MVREGGRQPVVRRKIVLAAPPLDRRPEHVHPDPADARRRKGLHLARPRIGEMDVHAAFVAAENAGRGGRPYGRAKSPSGPEHAVLSDFGLSGGSS